MCNICIVAGARPNFMKVAPIIRAIAKAGSEGRRVDCRMVYAGSETDATLEPSLFEDLQMPRPDVFLGVDSASLNELTGRVMSEFDRYLDSNPTDVVIVVDDLASTMAAAIVTKKRGIRLAHLVAGTRSFDITMPKEINRLVIDGLSDLLFTAGTGASSIVTREGAEMSQIYMVGNILMDTLRFNGSRLRRPSCLDNGQEQLADGSYLVLTLNRKALLADSARVAGIIESIDAAVPADIPVIAPLRVPARSVFEPLLSTAGRIRIVEPLPYLEFGYLAAHAKGIITDSGNVAEEATFNGVPCITLNSYTEHIETVTRGSNVLVGEDSDKLRSALSDMVEGRWKACSLPDRWDGRTAERIVQIILG